MTRRVRASKVLRGEDRVRIAGELALLHTGARAAWELGTKHRRVLESLRDLGAPTREFAVWCRARPFGTPMQRAAYRLTEASGQWRELWCLLCRLYDPRVERRLALETAGISPESDARARRKRGGAMARTTAWLDAEIATETSEVEHLRADRIAIQQYAQQPKWPRPTLRTAEVALLKDQLAAPLVHEVRRWRSTPKRFARGLWSQLIELREDRIILACAAVLAFEERIRVQPL